MSSLTSDSLGLQLNKKVAQTVCRFVTTYIIKHLVGGLEHEFYFSIYFCIYWEKGSQMTNIFQRG